MKVFVYGTLKRGHGNHRLLESSRFVGAATTAPEFTMLHLGGFPGIVRGGTTPIQGEVFEVDAPTRERLDRLEGHPGFYERQAIPVTLADGTEVTDTEGYVLPDSWASRSTPIATGVWTRRG